MGGNSRGLSLVHCSSALGLLASYVQSAFHVTFKIELELFWV